MKILIVDAAENLLKVSWSQGLLRLSWILGAFLFSWKFDGLILAKSWDDALNKLDLAASKNKGPVDEVQVWGHGSMGRPLIKGKTLPIEDSRVKCTKRWWFRSCHVLAGYLGHKLTQDLLNKNLEVAGHTAVIGLWALHPYLYAIKPGQEIYWSNKLPDDHVSPRLLAPRTILAFRMSLPEWAFKE